MKAYAQPILLLPTPAAHTQFLDSWALTKALPTMRVGPEGKPPYWVSGGQTAGWVSRGARARKPAQACLTPMCVDPLGTAWP